MKITRKAISVLLILVSIFISAVPAMAASKEIPITRIEFPEEVNLYVGEGKTVEVKVYPANTTYKINIQWGYQTNGCFKQKSNGFGTYWNGKCSETLTGLKVGNGYLDTTVIVYDSQGKKVATYEFDSKVYVREKGKKYALKSMSISPSSFQTLKYGNALQLKVSYNPEYTTDSKKITWTSSNKSIATVDANGKVIGKSNGTVTITAKCGSRTSSIQVCVYGAKTSTSTTTTKTNTANKTTNNKYPLQKITLNKTSVTLTAGSTATLSVGYSPSNTTDSKTVTWTTSNSSVATVSNGKITAKKAGTATITAKVGSKTATCKVTVKAVANNGKYWDVTEAYKLTNTFRTTKANQWYWNSDNKTKTTVSGLGALVRDSELEELAKLRAKEQWERYYVQGKTDHTRPNGLSWSTAYPSTLKSKGENLGWGQTSAKEMITDPNWGWAETNYFYGGQGHRRNILSKNYTKVGIACYEKDGKTCWAMCLGR